MVLRGDRQHCDRAEEVAAVGPLWEVLPSSHWHVQGLLRDAVVVLGEVVVVAACQAKTREVAFLLHVHLQRPQGARQRVAICVLEAVKEGFVPDAFPRPLTPLGRTLLKLTCLTATIIINYKINHKFKQDGACLLCLRWG